MVVALLRSPTNNGCRARILTLKTHPQHPKSEYQSRNDSLLEELSGLRERETQISYSRLATFIGAAIVFWIAFDTAWFSPWWALVPALGFVALILAHDTVIQTRTRAERAQRFYERGLGRLENRWQGVGSDGQEFTDVDHAYSGDLDLFGKASLFQYLSTARTRAGEETLAAWLLNAAAPEEVYRRQRAAIELGARLGLREDLAVLGDELESGLHPEALRRWSVEASQLPPVSMQLAPPCSMLITAGTLAATLLLGFSPLWFFIAVLTQIAVAFWLREKVQTILRKVQQPTRDLDLLATTLARLETESFESPLLAQLQQTLHAGETRPSTAIAKLKKRVNLLDAARNQLFAPLGALVLWTTNCALAVESWRVKYGAKVPQWLDSLGQIEALCSIASYSYEHPRDIFPTFQDSLGFDCQDLGHPLISDDVNVRNDLRLDTDCRVLIVSGSNMSGKSTLLRCIGSNIALAQAGAPVRAASMSLSPLQIGAAMRIVDSLQSGTSHFYAEITRLRDIVGLSAETPPLLFLFDEILHGTNSHDRRIGAEAIIRQLIKAGAIGLVTTHDLALSEIAEDPSLCARNIHFQDQLRDGKMIFDYRMKEGIVRKSNAIALMRAVGLEIED